MANLAGLGTNSLVTIYILTWNSFKWYFCFYI